jgi:hypothetical protein
MKLRIAAICLAVISGGLLIGCGSKPPVDTLPNTYPLPQGHSWVERAIREAAEGLRWTLERIHEGTGWLLGKDKAKVKVVVERISDVRKTEDGAYEADFNIKVTSPDGSTTFDRATLKGVRVNKDGVPLEQDQARFKETVEKIKEILSKIQ